jgi:hypothetical protein
VSETNRAVGIEEAVTDADRASEGDVELTGRQAALPLRGSDESMYILYIWSTICIPYFLLISISSPSHPFSISFPYACYSVLGVYFVFPSVFVVWMVFRTAISLQMSTVFPYYTAVSLSSNVFTRSQYSL